MTIGAGKSAFSEPTTSLISSPDRLVAAIGIQDLVVIDTPDALLICSRSHSQDVKRVVEALKRSGRIQYL